VNSVLRISLAALFVVASPGCSLIFTKGPQPELHPQRYADLHGTTPLECTASVAAPVVDTTLAVVSFALLGLGVAGAATHDQPNCEFLCGTEQAFGWVAVIVGAAMGALFTYSAVVGYQRTSACRASLEPNALLPQPRASLLPASPADACGAMDDAPRACPPPVHLPGGQSVLPQNIVGRSVD
jgi:hypothetical protein